MRIDAKGKKISIVGALVFSAVVLCLTLWWSFGSGNADATRLYQTQLLGRGVVERSVTASGAVKALVTVDVGSQVSGPITEMKVDFNSKVKQGDLIAVIDRAPFDAKVQAASANLAIARADVSRREAAMAKLQKQLGLLDRNVGRYSALASAAGVSRQQLDQAQTESGATRHELSAAQADLESAKATVALRQAECDQAQINFDRTLIKSPINGVVIDRRMQRGQTVTAEYQTPVLFQIAQDLSQIQILAQVDEADVGAIRVGDEVKFTVETFPVETFYGVVEQIRLAATKTSGVVTYTVVVRAQNPDMRLFPDMTATVRIVTARRENVLNTPNEALRFHPSAAVADDAAPRAGQTRLWVLDATNSLKSRSVRLGVKGDAATEILDGDLKPGDAAILRATVAATPEK
ncbi:efflux RND transporter periplasmic adaptor subunit [Methylocystis sp. JR02]|uniref:efflux RND transporter periplasmic adaptor subunit n=1 Tax=Methylocystis sp. JR02 TaxID=3046284 RepID=UPI0024BA3584|nr:efflux RND transporter periplasmic adaptor subunit [Methylocystis sp. JR02]MDJ0449934.1 efflux RND transporter periplasmic adaptor subunit [Methylocystis sp. JR02]